MSRKQIGQCWYRAAVGHVNQIDSGHHLQHLAGQMAYAPVAG